LLAKALFQGDYPTGRHRGRGTAAPKHQKKHKDEKLRQGKA
ncbi:MAG: hypothetical protein ACI9D0_000923, partial [Bacteroidia bacterium]